MSYTGLINHALVPLDSFMRTILLIFMCLSLSWMTDGAAEMVTINLQHRLPEEVVKLIKPMLQAGERMIPSPNGLIVMAESQRVNEIRQLVEQLDRRSKQFVVSVVQKNKLTVQQLNAEVGIESRIPLNYPGNWRGRVDGRINQSESDETIGTRQTINVLEGHYGFIEVGEDYPVSVIETDGYYSYSRQLGYKKATTGFQLLPRLLGNCRVRLLISPWSVNQAPGRAGSYARRSAETSLEVALGEWFELGSHHQDEQQRQNQLLGYRSKDRLQQSKILVKIDSSDGCDTAFGQ